jgi:CRP-like cAMP-binding protein
MCGCLGCAQCRHPNAHSYDTVALTRCQIVGIESRAFWVLLQREQAILRGLLSSMGQNLWEAYWLRSLNQERIPIRVMSLLLWLSEKVGNPVPLTRQAFGSLAGTTTETAIRMLSPLERRGWILTRRGSFELLDPGAVKRRLRGMVY